jgi:hypothetical protein
MATTENLELYEIEVVVWHVTKEPNEAGDVAPEVIGLIRKGAELTVSVSVDGVPLKCLLKTFTRTPIRPDSWFA